MNPSTETVDLTHFDVRVIPCRQKHAMIFQRWAELPGGEHFVSGGRDWRLTLWRPGKTTQALDVQMLDSEICATRWSPDGKRLAVGEKKGRVTLFELVAR